MDFRFPCGPDALHTGDTTPCRANYGETRVKTDLSYRFSETGTYLFGHVVDLN
jgi:hypothetical protein